MTPEQSAAFWAQLRTEAKEMAIETAKGIGVLAGLVGFVFLWCFACIYFWDTTNPYLLFFMNFFGVCGGLG